MVVGMAAVFGSFGPVIAISALPGNLTQTFASGDRVLDLLKEQPAVRAVTDGVNILYDDLEVKDLSFGYEETLVLQDVCMHAEKGRLSASSARAAAANPRF